MAYDLTKRLVIGLSSSALFGLTDSDEIFRTKGEEAYREYQRENQNTALATGVAYPFIRRLLKLNELSEDPLVEVILLSRNDPDTGLRVMNSIEHYGLSITRAVFLQGQSAHKYIPAFDIELFLSANEGDVQQAVDEGFPAGQILDGDIADDIEDTQLRVAFDFDGVIIDDEAESVYKESNQLGDFHSHESSRVNIVHNPGPLKNFIDRLSHIQKIENDYKLRNPNYEPVLRVSIVTARNAPSHKRAINTMREWVFLQTKLFLWGS